MRWTPDQDNSDVEDRRGESGGGGGFGGSGIGGRHLGIGGFILLAVLSLVFKKNFFALVGGGGPGPSSAPVASGSTPGSVNTSAEEEKTKKFIVFVLHDVQKTWAQALQGSEYSYQNATLVLYRNSTRSGCGQAESSTGPFYCPADQKVYIDLDFYNELRDRFGAQGEFAQAYVLAHEIGHHVQKLLGIDNEVRRLQEARPRQANQMSVLLELQADCLAGVWAKSTDERKLLEAGDIESALQAAAAVGDDRLQKMATGTVHRETWTHGSSEQRTTWFQKGFQSGDLNQCNTFGKAAR